MARILTHGNYAVFVLPEGGERHHLPHAHIKHRGQRVASIFLISLKVFDDFERLPPGLLAEIRQNQELLLSEWRKLNGD